jgi:hypothetical protein
LRRRDFIAALVGAAVGWPLAASAQQPKVPTIGALVIGNTDPGEFWREFRQGLRDLGYVEGQNIRFEFRSAEGQANALLPHAHASHAIERGATLARVQATLGHGNISTTSGYLHARPDDSSGLCLDPGVFLR